MPDRLRAIVVKEIYHILRDPRSLTIIFIMPVLMVLLYGHVLNMDIRHIPICVVDRDHSLESRAVIRSVGSSDYFDIVSMAASSEEAGRLLQSGDFKAALIVPRSFARSRETEPSTPVQLLVDGSDPTFGNATVNYMNAILTLGSAKHAPAARLIPLDIGERFLFNPDLEGANFIIPGLVAVILMMVCALLTSITISREKETGTMDILLVSPVHPSEIVFGKVLPYVAISLLDAVFILVFAKIVFDIPLTGNLALLLGLSVLFIYCALSIGLFISSLASTQQVAMMAALVATILPSIMLSGFIFPIFSMPAPLRVITSIVPAKYYMEIIRGILLKGGTFDLYSRHALFLLLLGTFFLTLATVRFRTRRQA